MRKKIIIIAFLLVIPLLTSGCIINIKPTNVADGGVYTTYTKGDTWEQTSLIYRLGELVENFNTIDISALVMDPQDSQAIYAGTVENGILYSYNGATGWQQVLRSKGKISAIAVSPNQTCTVYAAIGSRVYKTSDCSRHWQYKLIEPRPNPDNIIHSLEVDPINSQIIYAGTSGKGLFRSDDSGYSWHAVHFFDDEVVKVLVDPANPDIIYTATKSRGLFRSDNKGIDWKPLFDEELKRDYNNVSVYRNFILDPTNENGLLYASEHGLMRSADKGENWQNIGLLTPPNTVKIYSLAINPLNGDEIFYGISTTLYRTEDGGQNWITRNLPTTRAAKFLMIDPDQPNTLYLGTKRYQ